MAKYLYFWLKRGKLDSENFCNTENKKLNTREKERGEVMVFKIKINCLK